MLCAARARKESAPRVSALCIRVRIAARRALPLRRALLAVGAMIAAVVARSVGIEASLPVEDAAALGLLAAEVLVVDGVFGEAHFPYAAFELEAEVGWR